MAGYSVNIVDNADGTYTQTIFKNPTTLASGGTSLTLPAHNVMAAIEDPKELLELAKGRIANDLSANLVE